MSKQYGQHRNWDNNHGKYKGGSTENRRYNVNPNFRNNDNRDNQYQSSWRNRQNHQSHGRCTNKYNSDRPPRKRPPPPHDEGYNTRDCAIRQQNTRRPENSREDAKQNSENRRNCVKNYEGNNDERSNDNHHRRENADASTTGAEDGDHERRKRYSDLKTKADKCANFSEKINLFNGLSWEQKLIVQGYGSTDPKMLPLPELPPDALVEQEHIGSLSVKNEAAECAVLLTKNKAKSRAIQSDDESEASDDSDKKKKEEDYFEDECDGSPFCRCHLCNQEKQKVTYIEEFEEDFLRALPSCLLFDAAFRLTMPRENDRMACWCPIGRYMEPWQKFFGLTGATCEGDGKKKKTPAALLAHLRAKGEQGCLLHYGVSVYLEKRYGDHNGKGLAHSAIYENQPKQTELFREALDAQNEREQRKNEIMKKDLEATIAKVARLESEKGQFMEDMEKLKKVSEDLAKELQNVRAAKEKLEIEENEATKEPELTKEHLNCYALILKNYRHSLKTKITNKKQSVETNVKFEIKNPNEFSAQTFLDEQADKKTVDEKSFLLRNLSFKKNAYYHAHRLINDWEIKFGEIALDDGGPTKHFLDAIWMQLPTLEVCVEEKSKIYTVEIFEEGASGAIPTTNDNFLSNFRSLSAKKRDELKEKAHTYYRAIGRIMFHSIVRGFTMSYLALPRFYRNVIFRRCNLVDASYNRKNVVEDLAAMGVDVNKSVNFFIGKSLKDRDLEHLGDDDEIITKDTFFTKVMQYIYIDNRSIALNALKEGLTLDGYEGADFSAVTLIMPEKAISKLLFAPPTVKVEDVLSCICIEGEERTEKQLQFVTELLPNLIREKAKKDKNFLSNFLSFVTGLSYLPYKDIDENDVKKEKKSRRIAIEFDQSRDEAGAFPLSKTCENVLILPVHAYDCDKEKFDEKLEFCLDQSKKYSFTDE